MAQKVYELFGMNLEIDPDVNEVDYREFRDRLMTHLTGLRTIDLANVEVYIHQLRINTEPTRFGVSPLHARLSKLGVTIEITSKAKQSGRIWFFNNELPIRMNDDVEVTAKKHRIAYSLSGQYCQDPGVYNDYIATLIKKDCPKKFRTLSVTGTAHATERFREKLLNFKGYTTTKMRFQLTKDRQLPLVFEKG